MHDYMHLLDAVMSYDATILLTSPTFTDIMFVITQTLSLPSLETTQISLDLLGGILDCACFLNPEDPSSAPSVANILSSLDRCGPQIISYLIPACIGNLPEECLNSAMSVFGLVSLRAGRQAVDWVHSAIAIMEQSRVSKKNQSDFVAQFDT